MSIVVPQILKILVSSKYSADNKFNAAIIYYGKSYNKGNCSLFTVWKN